MSRLHDVNTTDIRDAIRLGCRTMQHVFDADDGNVPFFSSRIRPETAFAFSPRYSEAHVPGRHLNALLNAEAAAGIELDEAAVGNHRRAALLACSGPLPLVLNRETTDGPPVNFCPHNLREGLHALYALAAFRGDVEAREAAERLIAAVLDLWHPDRGWDEQRLVAAGLAYQPCPGFIQGEARMLGPLVKHYRATGYAPALELALLMRAKAIADCFPADGACDRQRVRTHHAHSITCVLSSLAQLADLLGDAALLGRVKAFYDHGLWQLRDELGWSPERLGQHDSDHGEANNTGDILETALILGRWGYHACYADAERILRCHLLPAQLRDVSFIEDPPNPQGRDALRDVADRHLGAFGFPAPYGHLSIGEGRGNLSFNLDIVGGVVGSLCEAHREIARHEPTGHWVNLLFDRRTDAIDVESPYTHPCLTVRLHRPGPLFVRLPAWVEPHELRVEGTCEPPHPHNGYVFFAQPPVGTPIRLRFPLRKQHLTLSPQRHKQPIRVKLQGDAVVAMDNLGADLTFFDDYEAPGAQP